MILGFKKQLLGVETNFKEKILAYNQVNPFYIPKIHTIRLDENDRWKEGRSIQMAHGVRTKNYEQFNKDIEDLETCKSVQFIEMEFRKGRKEAALGDIMCVETWLKGPGEIRRLPFAEIVTLSINDGFTGLLDYISFKEYFFEAAQQKHTEGDAIIAKFSGKIIHWTDFKY